MQGHGRGGSFDTLRLLAALTVFHSHSFALASRFEPHLFGFNLGSVAVIVFFAMSGYWVSRSALERSLASFTVARALRIVPGLFVCALVTIAICALATSEHVSAYFRQADTWRWLQNALPFWLPQRTTLPGVFLDGAYHNANGSLWTLPYEVFCYVVIAMAALFGRKGLIAAMAATAILAIATLFGSGAQGTLQLISPLDHRWLALYAGAFFLGAWLQGAGDRTVVALIAVSTVALLVARNDETAAQVAGVFLYGSAAIWIGRNLDLDRRLTRGADLSYGIYIYAFPCEQLAARALAPQGAADFALYYAIALTATVALASLSWTLVEKPALRAKAFLAGALEHALARLPLNALRGRPVTD